MYSNNIQQRTNHYRVYSNMSRHWHCDTQFWFSITMNIYKLKFICNDNLMTHSLIAYKSNFLLWWAMWRCFFNWFWGIWTHEYFGWSWRFLDWFLFLWIVWVYWFLFWNLFLSWFYVRSWAAWFFKRLCFKWLLWWLFWEHFWIKR